MIIPILVSSVYLIIYQPAFAAISYWDNKNKSLAQQVYRQAINLDARYTQPTFLNHLKKAAFTQEQINTIKVLCSEDRE